MIIVIGLDRQMCHSAKVDVRGQLCGVSLLELRCQACHNKSQYFIYIYILLRSREQNL